MKFNTQFDKTDRVYACAGDPIEVTFGLHFDKNGVAELQPKGKRNVYDEIQSHADSVDINVILKKYAAGDISVLNQRLGEFADVTAFPKTFAEVLNTLASAEEIFNGLPSDKKAIFNNSVSQFVAAFDNEAAMQLCFGSPEPAVPLQAGEGSPNVTEAPAQPTAEA